MLLAEASKRKLFEVIEEGEGRERLPYKDTVGKLTIGVGFNLDDVGLYDEEIDFILQNRVNKKYKEVEDAFGDKWFNDLSDVRKVVVLDMVYNLGITKFRRFAKTIAYIQEGDFESASKEMLDSKWADQVGRRARKLSRMMREDKW